MFDYGILLMVISIGNMEFSIIRMFAPDNNLEIV